MNRALFYKRKNEIDNVSICRSMVLGLFFDYNLLNFSLLTKISCCFFTPKYQNFTTRIWGFIPAKLEVSTFIRSRSITKIRISVVIKVKAYVKVIGIFCEIKSFNVISNIEIRIITLWICNCCCNTTPVRNISI